MLTARLRNGKFRILSSLILCVCFILAFGLLRNVHIKLNEARETSEKCHQKYESLAAQLQVMSEHKSRLEQSLQLEIQQHKKTREDLEKHYQQIHDKEKIEATNRFNSLQQQYKMTETQIEDMKDEMEKLQQFNNNLLDEKQQLNDKLVEQIQTQKLNENQLEKFRIANSDCKIHLETTNYEMQNVKLSLARKKDQLAACTKDGKQVAITELLSTNKTSSINDISILSLEQNKMSDNKTDRVKRNDILDKGKKSEVKNDDGLDNKPNDETLQQLAPPNPPIAVNPEALNLNRKPDEGEEANLAVQEEFRANGLEQQENGEDQDLDNMEDEGEGAGVAKRKEEGKVFEDADFDQIEWH